MPKKSCQEKILKKFWGLEKEPIRKAHNKKGVRGGRLFHFPNSCQLQFTLLESPGIYAGMVEIESISSLMRARAKPCPF
jgi:hypothetical protein